MSSSTTNAIIDVEPQRSHFIKSLLRRSLWCAHQFLGGLFLVGITVPNKLAVFLECLTVIVSHQKHTPLSCARRRSLTPRRCRSPIAKRYSTRLFFTWFRTDAAVAVSLTVSTVASSVIILSLPHRCGCYTFVRTRCDMQ